MKHEHEYYSDKIINARIKRGKAEVINNVLYFMCSCCHDFNPANSDFYDLDRDMFRNQILKSKCKKCWVGRYAENKRKKELFKQNKLYNSFISLM